jgi:hypothetical protein
MNAAKFGITWSQHGSDHAVQVQTGAHLSPQQLSKFTCRNGFSLHQLREFCVSADALCQNAPRRLHLAKDVLLSGFGIDAQIRENRLGNVAFERSRDVALAVGSRSHTRALGISKRFDASFEGKLALEHELRFLYAARLWRNEAHYRPIDRYRRCGRSN